MPDAPSRARLARLHAGLVLAVVLCTTAFVVEVLRALSGNTLSWAYVFEWPLLLAYGVYMWQRLVREERSGGRTDDAAPAVSTSGDEGQAASDLAAYNRYLADLHAADRPGGRGTAGPPEPPDAR